MTTQIKEALGYKPHHWLGIQRHAMDSERKIMRMSKMVSEPSLLATGSPGSSMAGPDVFSPFRNTLQFTANERKSFSKVDPSPWTAKSIISSAIASEHHLDPDDHVSGKVQNFMGSACHFRSRQLPPSFARPGSEGDAPPSGRMSAPARGKAPLSHQELLAEMAEQRSKLHELQQRKVADPFMGIDAHHKRCSHPCLHAHMPDVKDFASGHRINFLKIGGHRS
mmetsp:Transcript_111334/g.314289  ORF Transcript_111334/g.314289 Transcript_111334/m.314289 type:complete len:223 (-) Transcript_111334:108-776(-)